MQARWTSVADGVESGLEFLRERCGVVESSWLPYQAMLLPVAALAVEGLLTADNHPTLERWFWSTAFGLGYEVGANTALVADFRELRAALADGGEPTYQHIYRDVIFDASRRKPAAMWRAFQCALAANDALDLLGAPLAYRMPGDEHSPAASDVVGASIYSTTDSGELDPAPHLRVLSMVMVDRRTRALLRRRGLRDVLGVVAETRGAEHAGTVQNSQLLPAPSEVDPSNILGFLSARLSLLLEFLRVRGVVPENQPSDESVDDTSSNATVDDDWLHGCRSEAAAGLRRVGRSTSLEVVVAIQPKGDWRQTTLLSAVKGAQVQTFGWPIGLVLERDDQTRPHPTSDGVKAEVAIGGEHESRSDRNSYDYWYLRRSGDYYLLKSLFEDERAQDAIFFDTRIVRTTELLLFLSGLYERLGVPDGTRVRVTTTYSGLQGRTLGSANPGRYMSGVYVSKEDSVTSSIEASVAELRTQLGLLVRQLLEPVFVLFGFFELGESVWDDLVDAFVAGEVR